MTLALRYAARSHTGLLRTGNEDSAYAGPRLLAVADGMGGHAAGEVASAVAIASLAPLDEDAPGPDLTSVLRTAAVSANDYLRDMVSGDSALEGMGTTLTALLFTGRRLGLLHIGDSRCYLLRDGVLTQITHDDTLVQTLVDEGRIDEEEASTHPQRSLITRALDGRGGIDFDLSVREAQVGDRYLLCTDGLTGPVGRRETLHKALELPDPQACVDLLVELALRGGGPDNVTVIVADVVDRAAGTSPVVVGAADEAPQPSPAHASPAGRAAASRRMTVLPAGSTVPAGSAVPASTARGGTAADTAPRPTTGAAPAAGTGAALHGRRRLLLGAAAVVALLALGLTGGWAWLRSQWYVGTQDSVVAVFRGVEGSLAGVPLATVHQRTTLATDSLDELDMQGVRRGIRASSRADADRIVQALSERDAPAARPGAAPTPDPTASRTSTAPSPTPSPARTP